MTRSASSGHSKRSTPSGAAKPRKPKPLLHHVAARHPSTSGEHAKKAASHTHSPAVRLPKAASVAKKVTPHKKVVVAKAIHTTPHKTAAKRVTVHKATTVHSTPTTHPTAEAAPKKTVTRKPAVHKTVAKKTTPVKRRATARKAAPRKTVAKRRTKVAKAPTAKRMK